MKTELCDGINWVGFVDWMVRDFHGYRTERGSSYNAYLVQDEKTAVIDSVKAPYASELLRHIRAFTPTETVDYVICNHAEPDHSGSLPALMKACPNAVLVTNERCRKALAKHYDTDGWPFHIVASGDTLALGRRSLTFVETPMVHWPESMFTYVPEEKLLFSMDAFGQHYASAHRFDDEEPLHVLMQEAKTYYANIVMLFAKPIERALQQAAGLDIAMIAPSHGVIWRTHIGEIIARYQAWVRHTVAPKVLVIYDSMWKSTEQMANAIMEGALELDADVRLFNVTGTHITVLATEVLDAAAVAVGSPTLNTTLMPSVSAVMTYWQGLKPAGRAGLAFGSYGWSKGGAEAVNGYLQAMKMDLIREPIEAQFVPSESELETCREAGRDLARAALARAGKQAG